MTRLRDINLGGIDLSGIRLGWASGSGRYPDPSEGNAILLEAGEPTLLETGEPLLLEAASV